MKKILLILGIVVMLLTSTIAVKAQDAQSDTLKYEYMILKVAGRYVLDVKKAKYNISCRYEDGSITEEFNIPNVNEVSILKTYRLKGWLLVETKISVDPLAESTIFVLKKAKK
jgi:hypothetical protein